MHFRDVDRAWLAGRFYGSLVSGSGQFSKLRGGQRISHNSWVLPTLILRCERRSYASKDGCRCRAAGPLRRGYGLAPQEARLGRQLLPERRGPKPRNIGNQVPVTILPAIDYLKRRGFLNGKE